MRACGSERFTGLSVLQRRGHQDSSPRERSLSLRPALSRQAEVGRLLPPSPNPKIFYSPKMRLIASCEPPLPPLEGDGKGEGGAG